MSSTRPQHRHGFRPKLIALSVAACFSLSATQSQANPTGGSVASGSASFAVSGNTLTITNSAGAIINWASFSIGINEITQFLQSSGASAVLNRVVGLNGVIPQSVIDGILSSNGRVFLLNQSGVVIGSTARIDVAGFVASSLNLSDQDFLAGRLNFTETPGAGAVSNAGIINTSTGGRVFLVAPDVRNTGIIRSPEGEIVLAAGRSVELVSEGSPFVTVRLTADSEQAINVGQLISASGHIGMFGALVRQGGVIEANSAVAGPNGEIRLVATRDLTLEAGSRTTANGESGGNILLQAQGGTNLIYGDVEATGSSGQGGTIQALGVRVGVLGSGVIDASGDAGGGTVLVGGDQHGDNPNVQNAEQVLIGPDGVIRADAGTTGDGGRVIIWSDAETRAYGSISAQGGSQSGNGGFVETSSAGGMDLTGVRVDTRAANGQWGTWLLDPDNVFFEPTGYGGDPLVYGNLLFTDNPGTTAHIEAGTVESAFATNGTVRIQATTDVNFNTNLTLLFGTPGGLFEVRAGNDINLAADGTPHTISTNGHSVVLSANDLQGGAPLLNPVGTGSITGGGSIFTDVAGSYGGDIRLSGYGVNVGTLQTRGGLLFGQTRGGNVQIEALAGGIQTGDISTRGIDGVDFDAGTRTGPTAGGPGGDIVLTVTGGSVSTGNLDASGGRGGNGGAAGVIFAGQSGGFGGTVLLSGTPTSVTTGTITTTGGNGGNGANDDPNATGGIASGGAGGAGGAVFFSDVTGSVSVNVGAINTSGGSGGNGADAYGQGAAGFGGSGGTGGDVNLAGTSVSTGPITTSGGNGGAGGATTVTADVGGQGGDGGAGGSIFLTAPTSVTVAGSINATGGSGGAGGGSTAGYGGNGGAGGDNATVTVQIDPDIASVGSIVAHGGAGGNGGNGAIQGGAGGAGGAGAFVDIFSLTYGSLAVGDIDVSGASGGAGGSSGGAGVYGGAGGRGGYGGFAIVQGGSIDLLSGGTILANGGSGGTGGLGAIPAFDGNGGTGGNGGLVELFAESASGAYGTIQIGAFNVTVTGGAGGGGGLVGANGVDGAFILVGNTASPPSTGSSDRALELASNTITQAANSLLPPDTTTRAEDIEKKNKEKKKEAVCK